MLLLINVQNINNMNKQKQQSTTKKAEQQYKQIIKSEQSSWQIIKNLNKLYKVDRILLKHAYDNYAQRQNLQKSNQFKIIDKFYRYVLKNLLEIQKNYLDVPAQQSGSAYHYQINKNSISKFIRDEAEHYKEISDIYFQKTDQEDKFIKGTQILNFIQALFNTKYTSIISNGQDYFKGQNRQTGLSKTIQNYCESIKQFNIDVITFSSEQMLDFLSFWIKQKENQHFFILYARTKEQIQKQKKFLKQQAEKNKQNKQNQPFSHPALTIDIKSEQQPGIKIEVDLDGKIQNQDKVVEIEQKKEEDKPILNIFEKYKKDSIQESLDQHLTNPAKDSKHVLTKREQLDLQMKQLFVLGCKRRYPLPKGITFDQIESETKTMNLEKFMNFCNYYHISSHLSRQLISEMFKLYALNRLMLDETRFQTVIFRMIETDQKVIDCLLKKESPQIKFRAKVRPSAYKFKIRPINGKSIETVEEQLGQLKIIKKRDRDEKLKNFLSKKTFKEKQSRLKKEKTSHSSYLLPTRTNLLELDSMRDDSFDPQKFFGSEVDELLSAYQSKVDKKQSGLESALSRRLQKGDKVLQKLTNRNLQQYY